MVADLGAALIKLSAAKLLYPVCEALPVQNRTRRMFNTPSSHFVPAPWQTEKINFSRRQFNEGCPYSRTILSRWISSGAPWYPRISAISDDLCRNMRCASELE